MTDGRTVLILDVAPEYVEKMRSALTDVPEFIAADRTLESPVDGDSGNLLRAAVADYKAKSTAGA